MLKKISVVVAMAALLVGLVSCGGSGSPEDAVKTVMEAFVNHDAAALDDVVCKAELAQTKEAIDMFKMLTDEGGVISFEDMKYTLEESSGDVAKVRFTGTLKMSHPELGEQTEEVNELATVIKEDGKWKACDGIN